MEKEPTSKIQFLAKPSALCSVFGITSDLWRYRFGSLGVSVSVTNLRTFGPIILGGKFSQKTFFSSYFLKKPATQPGSLWAWYRFEGAWPKMLHESPFFLVLSFTIGLWAMCEMDFELPRGPLCQGDQLTPWGPTMSTVLTFSPIIHFFSPFDLRLIDFQAHEPKRL